MKLSINGFGRIGRSFLRALLQDTHARALLRVGAINIGPAQKEHVAYLFKYDTIMGTYPGSVSLEEDTLIIDGYRIPLLREANPAKIPWSQYHIDWVVEASGHFTARADAQKHCMSGAAHVLITAPCSDADIVIIPGVNLHHFDVQNHIIVSLGSCTTNALMPLLKVVHDSFTIVQGTMTTIHAYTNSQVLLDLDGEDLRRSRAAAVNVIPTNTGASDMLAKVLPDLASVIVTHSVRVPVANVSLIDVTVLVTKPTTVDLVHQSVLEAMKGHMKGIIGFSTDPLVSSDYYGNNHSVVVDSLLTYAQADMVKLFGWYDNEWGYSQRLKDFLCSVAQKNN